MTYKPDVVAPGSYTAGSGTSFAAPLVAATIALMCEYEPSLKVNPHTVKAILAASTGKATRKYITTDAEFAQYGAGVIDARSALWVISQGNYSSTRGALANAGDRKTYNMTVTESDTCMRIAVTHANQVQFTSGEEHSVDNLSDDTIGVVDIYVYTPDGELVLKTTSYTRGINLQVVEFDPTEYGVGTYTIKVSLREAASDGRTTYFGIGWR